MNVVLVAIVGASLLVACSRQNESSEASAPATSTTKRQPLRESKLRLLDVNELVDGDVMLVDGGMHGVAGHRFRASHDGAVKWQRRPAFYEGPDGPAGEGTLTLRDEERRELTALVSPLWALAVEARKLDEGKGRTTDRQWCVAIKRDGEVRVLEGWGWPTEVERAFAFANERIDALAKRATPARDR